MKEGVISLALDTMSLFELPQKAYIVNDTLMMGLNLDEVIASRVNSHFKRLLSAMLSNELPTNKIKSKELNQTISTTTDYLKVVRSNATMQIENNHNIKGWLYSSILDRRTSGLCLSLNNKFYRADKYKNRSNLPWIPNVNTHPHCRSILITIFENDDISKFKNVDLGTFLHDKDNEYEVRKLLGATKYQLFKDNELTLFDIFDYKKRGFKTIKEIRKDLGITANP